MSAKSRLVVNVTRRKAICVAVVADKPWSRMRGQMGRRGLPSGEGMLISPAPAIHTAFMRFDIDAVFLDRDLVVLDIVESLPPWRIASRRGARSVLELAAMESGRCGIAVGDRLELRERDTAGRARARGDQKAQRAAGRPAAAEARSATELLTIETRPEAAAPKSAVSRDSIIWPGDVQLGADAVAPTRVLVVSSDSHFRSSTMMLLAHRGCSVTTTANPTRAAKLVARDQVEVVVIDAGRSSSGEDTMAPALQEDIRPVGVVVVSDERQALAGNPDVLSKWGPFDELYEAVMRARAERGSHGAAA